MSVGVYSVFVLFCVGRGLATGWSPVQGVLQTVYRINKLKKRPRSKGLYSHRESERNQRRRSGRDIHHAMESKCMHTEFYYDKDARRDHLPVPSEQTSGNVRRSLLSPYCRWMLINGAIITCHICSYTSLDHQTV
jgi:hypothetical protein